MNHSPTHGAHIRRIRIRPVTEMPILFPHAQNRRKEERGADPLIIRRTYDISAACTRQNTDLGDEPLAVHIRGERATPLWHCAVIGAVTVGVAVSAIYLSRLCREWQIRRKYAHRYAERLREQRYRMQLRQKSDRTARNGADAAHDQSASKTGLNSKRKETFTA